MEDFIREMLTAKEFFYRLLFFVALFFISSFLLLWSKIVSMNTIQIQIKKLKSVNNALQETDQKQELITKFVDELSENYVIKIIIDEWQTLQRSLSNFQKYDFDLHISSFLRLYKFNQGNFSRNLLLIGLLLTFVFLSISFVNLGTLISTDPNADILGFINEELIPNIGLALTSTIAAIIVSFLVSVFGTRLENKVNALHKELSNFLIIHVHPTFETANDDTYLNKIKSVLEGLTQNIRESNQNLDVISTQSMNTLQRLGEGIGRFTQSADEFKSILKQFSEVQKQTYEHSSEIKLSVEGLNDSVRGISTIFEAEGNIIKEVNQSLKIHQEELSSLTQLIKNQELSNEKIENSILKLNHEFNNNLKDFQDSFSEKFLLISKELNSGIESVRTEFNNDVIKVLKEKTEEINSSFESVSKKLIQTANELDKEAIKNRELGINQIDDFRNSLLEITNEYGNAIGEIKESLLKSQEAYNNQTNKIIRLQEKLLRRVQTEHKIQNKSGLFESVKDIFKR